MLKFMKILCAALVLCALLSLTATAEGGQAADGSDVNDIVAAALGDYSDEALAALKDMVDAELNARAAARRPLVTIVMENGGEIRLELYPEIAPNTVANFVELAKSGFYDGVIFHRVISGFMIQGGDPEGTGRGGPGFTIKGEFAANGFHNTISHGRGVISMARRGAGAGGNNQGYDTAGSQFFIMHADYPSLDGLYAAFGRVIDEESMAVVDAIAATATDAGDKPVEEQRIRTILVDDKGIEYNPQRTND